MFYSCCVLLMADTAGQVIRCKAAVAWGPSQPLSIETIEVEAPKKGEVRIRLLFTSVCHSDATVLAGYPICRFRLKFPVVLGHEAVGVVESVGVGVRSVSYGDFVVPVSVPQCFNCKDCKDPDSNVCSAITESQCQGLMPDFTSRFSCNGKPLFHFLGCSTFTEYTVVPEISVCKINPPAELDVVGLMGCGFTTGYGSAVHVAKVTVGSTCAVFGLGAVGLSVIIGCKMQGASRIIAIDCNTSKFDLATKVGATECINPAVIDDFSVHIAQITDGGCDFSFECVGSQETIRQSLACVNKGHGECIVVGVLPSYQEVSIDPFMLLTGRKMRGAILGGLKLRDAVPKLVDDYIKGLFPLGILISNRLDFDQINDAFKLLHEGSVRTVMRLPNNNF